MVASSKAFRVASRRACWVRGAVVAVGISLSYKPYVWYVCDARGFRRAHPSRHGDDDGSSASLRRGGGDPRRPDCRRRGSPPPRRREALDPSDRKSTRLNSSHVATSYARFCLKKKNELEI